MLHVLEVCLSISVGIAGELNDADIVLSREVSGIGLKAHGVQFHFAGGCVWLQLRVPFEGGRLTYPPMCGVEGICCTGGGGC